MVPRYQSTKSYGHDIGLSCCFRQWRAQSHCKFLHGYALAVSFKFEALALDTRNWVVDFGSLKSLKGWLQDTFDHKLLVAEDDPALQEMMALAALGAADVVVVPACGCEKFAEMIYEAAEVWLSDNGYSPRCRLVSVEVREHGANSAIYTKEPAYLTEHIEMGGDSQSSVARLLAHQPNA
jgi:6-pyruvoyltetrahydropterin/6-carboxytetrahydropterin synthase